MAASNQLAQRTADVYRRATELKLAHPARVRNVVHLSADVGESVLISGDLHGHRVNFRRIVKRAALPESPKRHLILHEVCHGGPVYPKGFECVSHLLLEDVAKLIVEMPDRVHFLLSNHELAELTDFPITKGPRMLDLTFRAGLHEMYGAQAD